MESDSPLIRVLVHKQPIIISSVIFFAHVYPVSLTSNRHHVRPPSPSIHKDVLGVGWELPVPFRVEVFHTQLVMMEVGESLQPLVLFVGPQNARGIRDVRRRKVNNLRSLGNLVDHETVLIDFVLLRLLLYEPLLELLLLLPVLRDFVV